MLEIEALVASEYKNACRQVFLTHHTPSYGLREKVIYSLWRRYFPEIRKSCKKIVWATMETYNIQCFFRMDKNVSTAFDNTCTFYHYFHYVSHFFQGLRP